MLLKPIHLSVLAVLALGACVSAAPTAFEQDYDAARDALEAGDTSNALSRYQALITSYGEGPYRPVFEVEYAHALLRAKMADRAFSTARTAEQGALHYGDTELLGRARMIGALASADLAEQALARNAPRAQADQAIRTAFQALGETIARHPEIDPQGLLLERMRDLKEQMARLELEALDEERAAGQHSRARAHAHYILDHYGDTDTVLNARARLLDALAPR